MRTAIVGLLALVVFMVSAPLWAAPVTVNWLNPTQFEDGSAMVAADIASTTVQYGTCNGALFGTQAGQVVITGAASATTLDRPPGTHCFRAFTTSIAARGSLNSVTPNVVSRVVPNSPPRPPTIIEVILAWIRAVFGRFA